MNNLETIQRLLDNTYDPVSKAGTYSIKSNMHGRRLEINYTTIVHFASEKSLKPQLETARDQARQLIKDTVDRLKKTYKEEVDQSLKYMDKGERDNLELIQSTSNSPRKVAYYRYSQTLEFSD